MKKRMIIAMLSATVLLAACGQAASDNSKTVESVEQTASTEVSLEQYGSSGTDSGRSGQIDTSEQFTDRDMQQTPDLSDAEYITVSDGKDITIDSEGVYVLRGNAANVTVYVEAGAALVVNNATFKVTAINNNAFKNCKNLTSVTIGSNVTKIGSKAFYGCKNLKTIKIKSTKIKSIGKKAFAKINKNAKFSIQKKGRVKLKKLLEKSK